MAHENLTFDEWREFVGVEDITYSIGYVGKELCFIARVKDIGAMFIVDKLIPQRRRSEDHCREYYCQCVEKKYYAGKDFARFCVYCKKKVAP